MVSAMMMMMVCTPSVSLPFVSVSLTWVVSIVVANSIALVCGNISTEENQILLGQL